MKYFAAVLLVIIIGILVCFPQDKPPVLTSEQKVIVLTLQRDISAVQTQLAQLQAEFQGRQNMLQRQTESLQEMLKKLELPGYRLDPTTLEYTKVELPPIKK
jgi:conjugal transfer/entry exclusion protein